MGDSKHYLMASAKDIRGPNPRFKMSRQRRSKRKRSFRARLHGCTCTWTCIVCADDTLTCATSRSTSKVVKIELN
jgi:hypothetical protein